MSGHVEFEVRKTYQKRKRSWGWLWPVIFLVAFLSTWRYLTERVHSRGPLRIQRNLNSLVEWIWEPLPHEYLPGKIVRMEEEIPVVVEETGKRGGKMKANIYEYDESKLHPGEKRVPVSKDEDEFEEEDAIVEDVPSEGEVHPAKVKVEDDTEDVSRRDILPTEGEIDLQNQGLNNPPPVKSADGVLSYLTLAAVMVAAAYVLPGMFETQPRRQVPRQPYIPRATTTPRVDSAYQGLPQRRQVPEEFPRVQYSSYNRKTQVISTERPSDDIDMTTDVVH
jgi:hypothetical protein